MTVRPEPQNSSTTKPLFSFLTRPGLHPPSGRVWKDRFVQYLFGGITLLVSALLFFMGGLLVYRTWPLWQQYNLLELLVGQVWHPLEGLFGFAPFIASSVVITLLAMSLAVVPAVLSGLYTAEYLSSTSRAFVRPLLDLLVAIPSVVYGLWGILFVIPLIREYIGPAVEAVLGSAIPFLTRTNPSGYGLLAGAIVLAIVAFPLIASVTDEVLRSIPKELREALHSLGATRWEVTWCLVWYEARPGILAAIVLAFSRVIGETLAVMMVVGNTAAIPRSIFDTAYPLPALIANNYGEMMSVPLYESALMGAALLLLTIVLIFNVAAQLIMVRLRRLT